MRKKLPQKKIHLIANFIYFAISKIATAYFVYRLLSIVMVMENVHFR